MLRYQRRLFYLIIGLVGLVLASSLLYMVGMRHLEGEERGFWRALGWAGETVSTTGYGHDATWDHPLMVIFVVVLQFIGVFLVFLVFPIYLIPFLEERFQARVPTSAPDDLREHVVIYRHGPPVATLLEQLRSAALPAIVAEEDEAEARRLMARGMPVVLGRADDDLMRRVHLERARALVTNGADDENAAVILGARQAGFRGDILALVEEPFHRRALTLAGATMVYTPRHMLAAALAARASQRISPRVSGVQRLGRSLLVREIRIDGGSELAGTTLADAHVGGRTGAIVIGQWTGGRLEAMPGPEMRLQPGGIVVVVGSAASLERFMELAGGATALHRGGPFVVGGYGEVGHKVVELLREVDEETLVIDRSPDDGVDLVGDVLDPGVLDRAEVQNAQAVILALDTDSATLFASVLLRDRAPEVPVIARVNQADNVERIHAAGASFALSISQVSGQMLARRLLGEEAISIDPQLKLLKVDGGGLTGRHPRELGIRERTDCSVVAVERGDEVIVHFDDEFTFREDDAVYVCGDREATQRYLAAFPQEGRVA